jgi:hypothetical protein
MLSRQRSAKTRIVPGLRLFMAVCVSLFSPVGSSGNLPMQTEHMGHRSARNSLVAFCPSLWQSQTHGSINKPRNTVPISKFRTRRASISEILSGEGPKSHVTTMSQQQSYDDIDRRLQSYKYPESPYDFEAAAMPVTEDQTVTPTKMFGILVEVKMCQYTVRAFLAEDL